MRAFNRQHADVNVYVASLIPTSTSRRTSSRAWATPATASSARSSMSSAPEPEPDWTAGSGEAIEPFSSEPQRFEATLQQDLHHFFLLAPTALRNELFGSLFSRRCTHPFTPRRQRRRRAERTRCGPRSSSSRGWRPSPWKRGSAPTSSLRQVLGDALMALAVELHLRRHEVLLRAGRHRRLQESVDGAVLVGDRAQDRARRRGPSLFLRTQDDRFRKHEDRFLKIVASLDLAFLSFADLAAYLRESRRPMPTQARARRSTES